MKALAPAALAIVTALAVSAPAPAGEPLDPSAVALGPAPMSSGGWTFELVPYGWVPTTEGTFGAHGLTQSFKLDASDALDNLDLGGSLAFIARHDRWGFAIDGFYARVSDDVPLGGILFRKADITVSSAFANAVVSFNVHDTERTYVDLYAGGRVTYSKVEIRLQENLAPRALSAENENTWLDAIVGTRGRCHLTERFFFDWFADVGAGSSDLTWQVGGTFGYAFTSWLDGRIGYRYLSTDYDSDGLVYDAEQYGFMVGLGFTW